jgi:hypothetical protein
MGTPRFEIAKYSTQVTASQYSTESLSEFLTYVNEVLPNRVNSTTIAKFVNEESRRMWKYMTNIEYDYSLKTSSGIGLYSLPTACQLDALKSVLVSDSTAITSTCLFEAYTYVGSDEELEGNNYYAGVNGSIGLYPTPTYTGYNIQLEYQERPTIFGYASSDSTTIFNLDRDYLDLIRYRVMSRVAKSGNSPDVEMGNNYTLEANEIEKKIRLDNAKKKFDANKKNKIGYSEGWDA